MFQDTIELSGARMAPGSAHRRIVWTGPEPWWINRKDYEGIGVHVDHLMNSREAFDALGRYTLAKVPLYAVVTRDDNGKAKPQKLSLYGIARSDTKEAFMDVSVSEGYKIIQPEQSFEVCDAVAKDGYEVIGELAGGRDLWACVRLPERIVVAGEELKAYEMFYTSHDGKSSEQFKNVAQRPECRNTLRLALRENGRVIRVRHSGDISAKHAEAARIIRQALGYMSEFEEFANQLARTPFSKTDYGKLVDHLLPLPEDAGRAQTNAIKARTLLLQAISADNLNNIRDTAWGALNGVSDFNEHYRAVRNGTDDQEVKLERLFRRSFEDTTLVDKAQEFILELTRG